MKIYDFTVQDAEGNDISLAQYKGKVLLIVNTDPRSRYSYQYLGLQALYDKYHDLGLEILDFPCDQFDAPAFAEAAAEENSVCEKDAAEETAVFEAAAAEETASCEAEETSEVLTMKAEYKIITAAETLETEAKSIISGDDISIVDGDETVSEALSKSKPAAQEGSIALLKKTGCCDAYKQFGKLDINGANQSPLYAYLKDSKSGLFFGGFIKKSFVKYLVDRDGNVAERYASSVIPEKIESRIKELLKDKFLYL